MFIDQTTKRIHIGTCYDPRRNRVLDLKDLWIVEAQTFVCRISHYHIIARQGIDTDIISTSLGLHYMKMIFVSIRDNDKDYYWHKGITQLFEFTW